VEWTQRFYARQDDWSSVYQGQTQPHHHERATLIPRLASPPPGRVLELGAGGGQHAAATADAGYTVTAVEIQPGAAANARRLAETRPGLSVIEGDFYVAEIPGPFDVVTYWDGFGIGSDADQQRLLKRIAAWLSPDGVALVDTYTPWYAAQSAGHGWPVGEAHREYGFDAEGCRWLDTWRRGEETVTQSLRCYSPADLRLLLHGTGLTMEALEPGGGMDWDARSWQPRAALSKAMSFTAVLRPAR